jgi:hypothetical protein
MGTTYGEGRGKAADRRTGTGRQEETEDGEAMDEQRAGGGEGLTISQIDGKSERRERS